MKEMVCFHRFYERLIPSWPIRYLFIGTFNPEWDGKDNAAYFYGRARNRFWDIMPESLGLPSQIHNRRHPELLEDFLRENMIGLTDMVIKLAAADRDNPRHRAAVLSFKDEELPRLGAVLNDAIFARIEKNTGLLASGGVFLTRSSLPPGELGRFWINVEAFCEARNIRSARLASASLRAARLTFSEKVRYWRKKIQPLAPR